MNRTKFIERLLKIGISISTRSESGCPWNLYKQYADLTSLIDFRCDFRNGQCAHDINYARSMKDVRRQLRICKDADQRGDMRRHIRHRQMCCCSGCHDSVGHFQHVSHRDIDMLAKNFRPIAGFWREGSGCILPRSNRSTTCLGYSCGVSRKTKKYFKILTDIVATPWVRSYEPPEFINAHGWAKEGAKKRRKWITPEGLEQLIITAKDK